MKHFIYLTVLFTIIFIGFTLLSTFFFHTLAASCTCQNNNSCSLDCTTGLAGKSCLISSNSYTSYPTQINKDSWCTTAVRLLGDTDGNSIIDSLDYYYYVRVVNGALIPPFVNPDVTGDGEVGIMDRVVIISNMGSTPPTYTPGIPTATPVLISATPTLKPSNTPTPTGGNLWTPVIGAQWQWQLSTPVDQSVNVPVFDIDGFDNSTNVVSILHTQGKKVICYIDVGTSENFRSDYSSFPASVKGKSNGWPGEVWLDIRNWTVLGPIMQKRMDMCKIKGFDAIEPDNIDGYSNDTGFPLTSQDQITYNKNIAAYAHSIGLSIGLKNDVDQVNSLQPYFDWALNEQCFQYNECSGYAAFINAGKAVLEVEYSLNTSQFCSQAKTTSLSAMKKNLNLDAYREPCL